MELDSQLQDDSASFASSHSLPNSEDVDDLRLGAEGEPFSLKEFIVFVGVIHMNFLEYFACFHHP